MIRFDHTIIHASDPERSARFLAELLGVAPPTVFGHFQVVTLDDGASLDFMGGGEGKVSPRHFAFLISEEEFDAVFGRIREQGLDYWADPYKKKPGEINRNDGGRGVYFPDPDGHLLEVITRPYGSGGQAP